MAEQNSHVSPKQDSEQRPNTKNDASDADAESGKLAAAQVDAVSEWRMTTYEILNTVITGAGVAVAITVLIVYALQLKAMRAATNAAQQSAEAAVGAVETARIDQRAWIGGITITTKPATPQIGEVLSIEVTIRNVGKTPAKQVEGHVVVEPVASGASPKFEYAGDLSIKLGLLQPNTDYLAILYPARSASTGQPAPLTGEVYSALQKGESRLYVHGRLDYRDIFKRSHWTTFCYSLRPPQFAFWDACAEHNDSDDENDQR